MVIFMSDILMEKHICDTDIWVNICLGEVCYPYVNHYSNVYFSEFVENEILKWSRGESRFNKIADYFTTHKNNGEISVLYLNNFDNLTQIIVKSELQMYGFSDIDNKNKKIKNLGEYASAVFASQEGISNFHTNDNEFGETGSGHRCFPDLSVFNLNNILNDVLDHKIRINTMALIEREYPLMKQSDDSQQLSSKLQQLKDMASNRRLR